MTPLWERYPYPKWRGCARKFAHGDTFSLPSHHHHYHHHHQHQHHDLLVLNFHRAHPLDGHQAISQCPILSYPPLSHISTHIHSYILFTFTYLYVYIYIYTCVYIYSFSTHSPSGVSPSHELSLPFTNYCKLVGAFSSFIMIFFSIFRVFYLLLFLFFSFHSLRIIYLLLYRYMSVDI